jgi:Patatin
MFEQPRRILSFDGGGIRGILTAAMLEAVEDKLKAINPDKKLREYFDIIAGTSSGSIIALAVAQGMPAKDIKNLFKFDGERIFPDVDSILIHIIKRFVHQDFDWNIFNICNILDKEKENKDIDQIMSQPFYDDKGLEEVLREKFSDQLFGELNNLVIVPSYDVYNRQATVFKNRDDCYKHLPIWEVCKASCSAPVVFPAHIIDNDQFIYELKKHAKTAKSSDKSSNLQIPDEGLPFIDGGLVANNPVLCAIAECRKNFKELPSLIVSFGAGTGLNRISVRQAKGWGAFNWANLIRNVPLMDVFTDGSSDATDYITQNLVEQDTGYVRFQPLFQQDIKQDIMTFSADGDNIIALEKMAADYIDTEEYKEKLETIVNCLISEKPTNLIGSLSA